MEGDRRLAQRVPVRLTSAEGRRFGLTVGGAFAVLGGVAWWRGHPRAAVVLASLGALLILAGLSVPQLLGPVQRAWMGLAHAISRVTTPVFMGVVYFVVLAPVGIVMRVIGRNPLGHGVAPGKGYWVARSGDRPKGDMEHQF